LVIYTYTSSLMNQHEGVVSRPYVDVSTSDFTGNDVQDAVETVSSMCTFASEFAAGMKFHPNLLKSKRFSTSANIRAALRLLPGPPVADAFADLGVAQTQVAKLAAQLNDKRLKGGVEKIVRTTTLALSLRRRGLFTAALGVPAATYGSMATPLAVLRLRSLDLTAYDSCWRISRRSASELVCELFVPWRVHPSAVILVKPVLGVKDALARGSLTLPVLMWMWDGPKNPLGRGVPSKTRSSGLA
jgi:hypothetical protein